MFNFAQSFFIDASVAKNVSKVLLKSVSLYFKARPKISGNKSGIYAPGVELFVVEMNNDIPELTSYLQGKASTCRKEYLEINTSEDASVRTIFSFTEPFLISTNKAYAVVIKFDGDEDFLLHHAVKGEKLIGTNTECQGPSGPYIGEMFSYVSKTDQGYSSNNWKSIKDTDLKFSVTILQTSIQQGNIASTPILDILAQSIPTEFVTYDKRYSSDADLIYGDFIFQEQPYYPGGVNKATVSVTANSDIVTGNSSFTYSNGATFSWSDLFQFNITQKEYIVIESLNHYGNGQHAYAVRQVLNDLSGNTSIYVDETIPFTNTAAYFYKSPVGRVQSKTADFNDGTNRYLLVLTDSNANQSCRFTNDCITSITLNAGGSGYSNNDYVVISGYENVTNIIISGYSAYANIVTNSSGGITATYFSNAGCGFVNTSAITYAIKANTGANSTGTGANLSFTTGSTLKTEYGSGNTYFKKCKILNFDVQDLTPDIAISQPAGTDFKIKFSGLYYSVDSSQTLNGRAYFCNTNLFTEDVDFKNQYTESFKDFTPVIPSRSNQFTIPYTDGTLPNTSIVGQYFSNAALYQINCVSNSGFSFATVDASSIFSYYSRYFINNDYTNEHTNYGNALAKHITTKVNFENDQKSEDLIVYVTAFRPANTDIKVYARIHNSQDIDAFDDKDWTLLEQVGGIGVYSNPLNQNDMVELTYNFSQYPNSQFTCSGTVTATISNNVINGSGNNFSNIVANDLVKIYSPLFANTNYIIDVVSSVTNTSQIVLSNPISNVSVTGSGLKVDKIQFPHQAFNNMTSDNVCRYYDSSMVAHDTFDTFQIKVIMLSSDSKIVPKIDDIRSIGVSA